MDKVYSVSQINFYIKNMFVKDNVLNGICIKGEVSNCKYHTSGHIYFTIKDEAGQLACVMFAGQRAGLNFRMSEGMSVLVSGSVGVYERDGKYQLYANEIRMDGLGILYERFEQLKRDLSEEGLFDVSHKKQIPAFIKRLGIVTAETGAAIRDIINISHRRNPYVQLILYPARVQGDGAAETIVRGIRALEKYGVDTIIVGRGGGSIEDLWAFNEELTARAIYDCRIPIISAVGHETDTTIADYVADLRAPTPSAAAELAVYEYAAFQSALIDYHYDMYRAITGRIDSERATVEKYMLRLKLNSPDYRLKQYRQQLTDAEASLERAIKRKLENARHLMAIYIERLSGLSPLRKLKEGYSYVTDERGINLKSIKDISRGDRLNIQMTDGNVEAVVTATDVSSIISNIGL